MQGLAKLLVLIAAVSFLIAVAQALFLGNLMGIPPESFSRAANNLALIGIGFAVAFKETPKES
ncbi:MAG TPA: hypothetical protein VMT00_03135 [Thermoanaerobaculia bacterium]|nr:hypothetical protein [Thermoanaerobaculia bacterium]